MREYIASSMLPRMLGSRKEVVIDDTSRGSFFGIVVIRHAS